MTKRSQWAIHLELAGVVFAALGTVPALAASHSWRINEVFSSADGTVQFIELKECCGFDSEINLANKFVKSVATGNTYTILSNIAGPTGDRHILLGTAAFAALPGAPTPNHIIPANFFSTSADTIEYHFSTTGIYHSCAFGSGALPTDGVNSITFVNYSTCQFTVGQNSPTNYAGESGSVNAGSCVDNDMDGYGSPGDPSCPNGAAEDCNDANADIHPGATELCNDLVDNDCDLTTDCDDADCVIDAACIAIPAMSPWGVVVLGVFLVAAGLFVLARRRATVKARSGS